MAKLESSFKNMLFVLTLITVLAGALLASVYALTKEPIEIAKLTKQQNAIKEVLPEYDRLAAADTVFIERAGNVVVYRAYDAKDNLVGAAVESISKKGFSGEVKIMIGFDAAGTIVNYSVLEQKETPGLGTKMVDWFKTEKGNQNILEKNPGKNNLKVTRDGGEIDAITAATISSRAFLDAVQDAYIAFSGNSSTDTTSGATTAASTDADSGATNAGTTDADSSATPPVEESTDASTGATSN